MARWTIAAIPPQNGKLAYITGANSGIGYHAALELARAGATVILGCRDSAKAASARQRILAEVPGAHVEIATLDLGRLDAVRAAAQTFLSTGRTLDLLIDNAGIMALPERRVTPEGFELQLGTNHFGHFALTGLLLPALLRSKAGPPRIITVSSIAHRGATMDFHNLEWERGYEPWPAYRRSKLANLLFGFELERRLQRAGSSPMSVVVHPGVSNTNLFKAGPGSAKGLKTFIAQSIAVPLVMRVFGQSDAQGALPILYAATAPEIQGGRFYGPDGFREMKGYPVEVRAEAQAYDEALAARLWEVSEQLTGVRFAFGS